VRKLLVPLSLALVVIGLPTTAGTAEPVVERAKWSGGVPSPDPAIITVPWTGRINRLLKRRSISVSVGQDGTFLYRYRSLTPRTPASNQKLLLSMAILDELGPDFRIETTAEVGSFTSGVVSGDLWILGGGDPEITAARMGLLARELEEAGMTLIDGSVRGSTTYFEHDWWAPGWKPYFPRAYVALPTALAFNFNTANGVHIRDPERRAAVALTQALRARGIRVHGEPGAGEVPDALTRIASVNSAELVAILRSQNVPSDNFYAETLGKLLGATDVGEPGTIAKGAEAIDAFAEENGATRIDPKDSSGLSYRNIVTADDIVRLLWYSDTQTWADDLRAALPAGGQGTLYDRLRTVDVRAKTGTLTATSALSGWVRSESSGEWVEFSILSKGMPKSTASHIEDRIVAIVANSVG